MRLLFRTWRLRVYVLAEFAAALGLAAGVLLGLFLLMSSLGMLRMGERHGLDAGALLLALPYLIPYLLCFALPLAFLVAGIITFGRLESAGELCAMRAAGVSLWTVATGPLAAALAASVLLLVLVELGVGWGFARAAELVLQTGRASLSRKASRSHTIKLDLSDRALRIHRFAEGPPHGKAPLAIVEFAGGQPSQTLLAHDHELDAGKANELSFAIRNWVRLLGPGEVVGGESGMLELAAADPETAWQNRTPPWQAREYAVGLSSNLCEARALRATMQKLEQEELTAALTLAGTMLGGGIPHDDTARRLAEAELRFARSREAIERASRKLRLHEMEVHRKLSMVMGPIALVLLGIPLGVKLARGGTLAGFAAGVAVTGAFYYPLWMSGQGLAASGILPPALAVGSANLVAAAAGLAWLRKIA